MKNTFDYFCETVMKYCGNNPGAITFFMECFKLNSSKCSMAFERMNNENIREDKLYMIWNDCCDRNTEKALDIMLNNDINDIIEHINYGNGRGIPYND